MNDFTVVQFNYVNHRGERAERHVRPIRVWFGSTGFHPEGQWFLEAFDLDRQGTRDFAMSGIEGGWGRLAR
jgi:predicted DNA-binding transcriptional regulator YafY